MQAVERLPRPLAGGTGNAVYSGPVGETALYFVDEKGRETIGALAEAVGFEPTAQCSSTEHPFIGRAH